MTALERAIEAVGGVAPLASSLGIKVQSIYQWGDEVPPLRVIAVERITGVSRYDLRPDLYPPDISPQPATEAQAGNSSPGSQ